MITLEHSPIHSDPDILGGTLVFRGTRVQAQTLLDYLDDGYTLEEFLENFPSVNSQDAVDFLRLARATTFVTLNEAQRSEESLHSLSPLVENERRDPSLRSG